MAPVPEQETRVGPLRRDLRSGDVAIVAFLVVLFCPKQALPDLARVLLTWAVAYWAVCVLGSWKPKP
jgi:hypothetical protein